MKNLIFLDTETTGKDETARMVQLCYHFENGNTYNQLFKPPVPIGFEAMATHHITQEMVNDKPVFAESAAQSFLQSLLKQSIVVAHNAVFDIEILKREGVEVKDYICTLKIAQNLFDLPSYKLQYLRYWANLNIKARAHDAEGDVSVLKALFKYLFNIYKETGLTDAKIIEIMQKISQQPSILKRIMFGKYRGQKFDELPKDYLSWLRKQDDIDLDLKYTLDYYLKK